jgi:hypothetical protein
MSNFVNNDVTSGSVIQASDHNTQGSLIAAVINGGLDNNNIASNAGIAGSKLADSGVDFNKVAAGACVQEVEVLSGAATTGTTLMVQDDTIPQNNEGNQWMTLSITPKATTHKLVIEAVVVQSHGSASTAHLIALFQDSTANALNATGMYQATSTGLVTLVLRHEMAAGTTSATTFKIRGGCTNAGTVTFNGVSGSRIFGGITLSSIVIREYKA